MENGKTALSLLTSNAKLILTIASIIILLPIVLNVVPLTKVSANENFTIIGTVTSSGNTVGDATVHITTGEGTWEFSTSANGSYSGIITVSGEGDTITVSSSHPALGSGATSTTASGTSSTIDIELQMQTTTTMTSSNQPTVTLTTEIGATTTATTITETTGTPAVASTTTNQITTTSAYTATSVPITTAATATATTTSATTTTAATTTSATTTTATTTTPGGAPGFPHTVYGTITCDGVGQVGASVHVTTAVGSWDFTTLAGGIYGGDISITGTGDTITVTATYPGYDPEQESSSPTGSATRIDIDLHQ